MVSLSENIIINLIQGVVIAISACFVIYEFFKLYFDRKKIKLTTIIPWLIYFLWQSSTMVVVIKMDWYISLLLSISLIILIGVGSYTGSIRKKVLFSIILCAIWTLLEFLVSYILLILNIDRENVVLAGSVLSKLALFLVVIFSYRLVDKREDNRIQLKYTMVLSLVPIGSIIIVSNIFFLTNQIETTVTGYWEIASSIIVLILNIIIIKIYFQLSAQIELVKINTVYNQQLQQYDLYMKEKEEEFLSIRALKHDMKQQHIYLMNLLEQNKVDESYQYIKSQLDVTFTDKKIANTDNLAVDSIINYKATIAKEKHIDMSAILNIPTEINIMDTDMCIILGNLIDNAIEANLGPSQDKKYIKILMQYDNGNIYIEIKNSNYHAIRKNKKGTLVTTKPDKNEHGIGILSVKKALEKYNGVLELSNTDKEFISKILLYKSEI